MTEDLIRAIWNSGWRAGHECGQDAGCAFEHGAHPDLPQNVIDAWAYYVSNRPTTIKGWGDVP